jgi:hypothetical protein
MIDLHVFVHSLVEKRKKNQRTTLLMCWCHSNIHPRNVEEEEEEEEEKECKKRTKETSLFLVKEDDGQ